MVALVEMTQEELDEYLEHAIQGLADELMQANAWSAEQSLAAAVQSIRYGLAGPCSWISESVPENNYC